MARIEMGLKSGSILVLVNPESNNVIETFTITDLVSNEEIKIEDSLGRVFTNPLKGKEIWVHPLVLIRLPDEKLSKYTVHGYVTRVQVYVEIGYRLHFADYLKKQNPDLFSQIPFKIRKGV